MSPADGGKDAHDKKKSRWTKDEMHAYIYIYIYIYIHIYIYICLSTIYLSIYTRPATRLRRAQWPPPETHLSSAPALLQNLRGDFTELTHLLSLPTCPAARHASSTCCLPMLWALHVFIVCVLNGHLSISSSCRRRRRRGGEQEKDRGRKGGGRAGAREAS